MLHGVLYMKTGKQILKILALILLICVTLLLLVLLVMIIYAKGNISYEADEALFISAKENKGVKLYYGAKICGHVDRTKRRQ